MQVHSVVLDRPKETHKKENQLTAFNTGGRIAEIYRRDTFRGGARLQHATVATRYTETIVVPRISIDWTADLGRKVRMKSAQLGRSVCQRRESTQEVLLLRGIEGPQSIGW